MSQNGLKARIRRLMLKTMRAHRILGGRLQGHGIVTSWHDSARAILGLGLEVHHGVDRRELLDLLESAGYARLGQPLEARSEPAASRQPELLVHDARPMSDAVGR